ncbi:MAG: RNA polymerase sigma-70 factor [Mangrovibacterium sp.]
MTNLIDWKKIREGDKAVFDKMFDDYYLPLCSFISSYVKNQQVIEDLVIDCFVKIWEERRSLEIKSSLQNYLVTIVKNSAISYLRQNQIQFSDPEHTIQIISDEEIDPLKDAGILNKLYDAINKLPEQRRRILKMAAFEGKSYNQIADEFCISVNTVKTQMSRSYKFLRQELDVTRKTLNFLLFM